MGVKTRIHIFITGYVHGVTFRANTLKRARVLGLAGWVKNTPDGLEAVVEGDRDKINELVEWMKHGPKGAEVHDIKIKQEPCQGEFIDFEIKYE